VSRHKPLWIELADGHSAAVGVLRRGRRGFFVLGRRTYGMASRPIVASGHFENGRVVIFHGVLSTAAVSELEQKLRSQQ
jgi:hypothetical protein